MRFRKIAVLACVCCLPSFGGEIFDPPGARLPGLPPHPPLITTLSIMYGGIMAYEPTIYPTGPVASVTLEEFEATDVSAGTNFQLKISTTTELDESGRPKEVVIRPPNGSRMRFTYRGKLLVSTELVAVREGRPPMQSQWRRWIYDADDRLQRFQSAEGDRVYNDYSFEYDAAGRVISIRFHGSSRHRSDWRTEYKYVSSHEYEEATSIGPDGHPGEATYHCTLDTAGRVTSVIVTKIDEETRKPQTMHTAFRYDKQSRLIAQITDPYTLTDDGSESMIPPGTVTLSYDDVKHTKTVVSPKIEGTQIGVVFTYDDQGSVIRMVGQASPHSDADSLEDMDLQFVRDQHGNWTECTRYVTTNGKREKNALWKRTIVYRQP